MVLESFKQFRKVNLGFWDIKISFRVVIEKPKIFSKNY